VSAQPKVKYTLEEYLAMDRNSEERLEYWDGEIYSMSDVSRKHNRVEIIKIAVTNSVTTNPFPVFANTCLLHSIAPTSRSTSSGAMGSGCNVNTTLSMK
jgi:hypothetical protein